MKGESGNVGRNLKLGIATNRNGEVELEVINSIWQGTASAGRIGIAKQAAYSIKHWGEMLDQTYEAQKCKSKDIFIAHMDFCALTNNSLERAQK